ncbi:hypothetical protein KEM60_02161 [Austwickia sp. TVS 96-490-7B]|uniref:peptidase n=1 Tax=Austwickia sp. TVS 96-490-7B TaxID=2830843 RepID=UPI001C587B7B|nr:peptidase [Austwickia sp. TVS 96-490-7B]MBW3085950.1 hypothetical protein [Austwickia sp. TVS 96-490-7B]
MKTPTIASLAALAGLLLLAPSATGAQAADAPTDKNRGGTASSIDSNLDSVKKMTADYLAKQYGLDKETATKRVEAQGEFSSRAQRVTDELGGDSAGSYIDQKRGVLVVQATKDDAKNKVQDKVKNKNTEIKVVARSMSTLEDQAKKLTEKLGDKLVSARVDVPNNKVVVAVKKDQVNPAKEAAKGMDGVDVEGAEAIPEPQADLYGGQQYELARTMCSTGFMGTKDGKDVLITAGHCAELSPNLTRQGQPLATVAEFTWPQNDMAYAFLAPGWTGQPGVDKWNGRGVGVKGSQEAPVGAAVCKSGRTTGWTCGTITAKNVTINYSGSGRMGHGLTQSNTCTEGGDSGGAWIAGDQAQGIHSAGGAVPLQPGAPACGKNKDRGNTAFFQPINPLLQKYNLQLKLHQG